jgi:hypothetical protein
MLSQQARGHRLSSSASSARCRHGFTTPSRATFKAKSAAWRTTLSTSSAASGSRSSASLVVVPSSAAAEFLEQVIALAERSRRLRTVATTWLGGRRRTPRRCFLIYDLAGNLRFVLWPNGHALALLCPGHFAKEDREVSAQTGLAVRVLIAQPADRAATCREEHRYARCCAATLHR